MKFINYLSSIAGVEIFPLISLGIFFLFFTGLLIYVYRQDKHLMNDYSQIPFETTNKNKQA